MFLGLKIGLFCKLYVSQGIPFEIQGGQDVYLEVLIFFIDSAIFFFLFFSSTLQYFFILTSTCFSPEHKKSLPPLDIKWNAPKPLHHSRVRVRVSIIKKVMGFRKRSHHTNLQKALNITLVDDSIHKISAGLLNRIFHVETPASHLQAILLSNFLLTGLTVKGTLINKLVTAGLCPLKVIFECPALKSFSEPNEVVDSLKYLVLHNIFIKPLSEEYVLATLLTKAF
jgi:hypothetical protein